ncbi:MAG TPA: hypothetical protein VLJ39_03840 [Tepidisphaeraceae bacterium]|nr:hypothetical protein [Tepidisphaeraceae bacterium]
MSDSPVVCEPSITADRYYALIRGQIEHEDNLIGQRLSWFVASQSFFFTAYAIVMTNLRPDHLPWVFGQMRLLLLLIPLVAIVTCMLLYATIVAGFFAIRELRKLYQNYTTHEITTGLPPVQGYRRTQLMGQAAPLFLPLVFTAVWMVLLFRGPW